ncbi:MAG: heme exporter protein CcmB [Rhodospirillaceae bacterium]|nr:heme exporter protein CcmB [Rhodospirillaceae bacterium]
MIPYVAVLRRDLRSSIRHGADTVIVLAFFVVTTVLFPLGVGPVAKTLATIAPGVIWVAALLATLLSLDRLFAADYEDGTIDLFVTSDNSLILVVVAKCLAHWLTTGLPLILLSPILATMLNLPASGYLMLALGLLIGTPVLTLIGAVGAALVLGARRGGAMIAVVVLPLYIPVLIFGVLSVDAVINAINPFPNILMLTAALLVGIVVAPPTAAFALRAVIH